MGNIWCDLGARRPLVLVMMTHEDGEAGRDMWIISVALDIVFLTPGPDASLQSGGGENHFL